MFRFRRAALAALLAATPASAADYTWTGAAAGTGLSWTTPSNWGSTTSYPGQVGDAATIDGASPAQTGNRSFAIGSDVTLGSLTVMGPASGFNSYANDIAVSGGTLTFDAASGNAALTVSRRTQTTISGPVRLADTLVATTSSILTFNGAVTGAGGLTKMGSSELRLYGSGKSYTGATTVNFGTLRVAGDAAVMTGTSAVTVNLQAPNNPFNPNGGRLVLEDLTNVTFGPSAATVVTLNGTGYDGSVSRGALSVVSASEMTTTLANTVNIGPSGASISVNTFFNLAGPLTGSGTLTKVGDGHYLTLQAPSSNFTGGLTLTIGQTSLMAQNALGSGPLTLALTPVTGNENVLLVVTANQSTGPLSVDWSKVTTLNHAQEIAFANDSVLTLNQTADTYFGNGNGGQAYITGGGGLVLAATSIGTLTLGGYNNYNGGTTIAGGTLALANLGTAGSGVLNDTGAVTVSGGTLALGSATERVGAVTLSAGAITGTGTLIGSSYDVRAGSVSAALGGTGAALTKSTPGTVTLSGANTYTGATTVTAGTLRVDGSLAAGSAVTVAGGTLGGTGVVNGMVAVMAGGAVGPGNGIGTLTVGGLSFADSSVLAAEVGGPARTNADRLVVTGAAGPAAPGAVMTVAITGNATGYADGVPVSYLLIDATAASSAFTAADFTLDTTGFTSDTGGSWSHYVSNGDLFATFTPTPEPGTVLGVAALGLGAASWVRRRRN